MTPPSDPRPAPPAPRPLPRLLLRGAAGLGLTAAALLALWLGVNVAGRSPIPAARYTEASLPPLPPADQNGWVSLDEAPVPSLPQALVALATSENAPTLDAVKASQAPLDALLADAAVRKALDGHKLALAKPRFTDACPLKIEARCDHLRRWKLHQLAGLSALSAWGQGRWGDAAGQVAAQLRADVDGASTARSLIGNMIAMASLRRSLLLAETLASQAPSPLPPDDQARLAALQAAARALDPAALTLRRAAIAENIHNREALALVLADPSAAGVEGGMPPGSSLFFDVGATARVVDEQTDALLAAIDDPAKAPPIPAEPTGLGWLYNPVGKLLLRGTSLAWGEQITRYRKQREAALAGQGRLLALAPRP